METLLLALRRSSCEWDSVDRNAAPLAERVAAVMDALRLRVDAAEAARGQLRTIVKTPWSGWDMLVKAVENLVAENAKINAILENTVEPPSSSPAH